jgi:hypothetical protein
VYSVGLSDTGLVDYQDAGPICTDLTDTYGDGDAAVAHRRGSGADALAVCNQDRCRDPARTAAAGRCALPVD